MFFHPLAYSSLDWLSRPWTLWTAPLLHLSTAHGLANVLALAALWGIAAFNNDRAVHTSKKTPLLLRRFTFGVLWAWPITTLSLIFCPQVSYYVGLSGLVHAATALLALLLMAQAVNARLVGGVLLLGLAAKLWLEQAWLTPLVWSADWGFHVVVIAHLYGAVVGLVVGAAMLRLKPQPESA